MSENENMKNAKNEYDILCRLLDEREFKYEKFEEDLVVSFIAAGEDIPMQFIIYVDSERELIFLKSPIPFTFDENKRTEAAIAVCLANYSISDGNFDFDYASGQIAFRLTSSFMDSLISEEVFEYMLCIAGAAVDKYNDKFLMLAKGMIKIEDFFEE